MDFNQSGTTNLTVGWIQERWGIHLLEETIDYKSAGVRAQLLSAGARPPFS